MVIFLELIFEYLFEMCAQVDHGTVVDEGSGALTSSEWQLATMGANLPVLARAEEARPRSRGRAGRAGTYHSYLLTAAWLRVSTLDSRLPCT